MEGMGKTTLAHVVATHCGYRPFEINASDDRSAPALKDKMVSTCDPFGDT
jgi:chromosome transmission fidelity protein 18